MSISTWIMRLYFRNESGGKNGQFENIVTKKDVCGGDIMRLQGDYSDYPNKTVKTLIPGDVVVWNYGYKSEVLKLLPSKTGKTYTVILRSLQDGVFRSRKMGANTQVAIDAKLETLNKRLDHTINGR